MTIISYAKQICHSKVIKKIHQSITIISYAIEPEARPVSKPDGLDLLVDWFWFGLLL